METENIVESMARLPLMHWTLYKVVFFVGLVPLLLNKIIS